jgi:hypothetical protein
MKYIIIAILVYLAYLFLKGLLNNYSKRNVTKDKPVNTKPGRKIDLQNVQDAEFREVKKE